MHDSSLSDRISRAAWWLGASAGLWLGWHASAVAGPGIYSCVDAHGKRYTSDRPIVECLDREQRVHSKDGSPRLVIPPRMNAEERAAAEERRQQKLAEEAALKDAIRRDRNLMMRYPDEAAHNKARKSALEDLQAAIRLSERRVQDLIAERKPLESDAEFYKGKRLPGKLRTKLDANDAAQQAQRDVIEGQKAEMVRINSFYDAELHRLKRLWAGAAPGFPDAAASAASSAADASKINPPASSSKAR